MDFTEKLGKDTYYFFKDPFNLKDWNPYLDPVGQLKRRRLCFLIVLVISIIIMTIWGVTEGSDAWITGGIIGAFIGAIYGFGIVNLLSFIIIEWEIIRDDFASLKDFKDPLYEFFPLIKMFLCILFIKTILWRPIKLFCYAVFLCPFIGIYQSIRLLIERGKLKKEGSI